MTHLKINREGQEMEPAEPLATLPLASDALSQQLEVLRNELHGVRVEVTQLKRTVADRDQTIHQLQQQRLDDAKASQLAIQTVEKRVRLEFADELGDARAKIQALEADKQALTRQLQDRRYSFGTCRGECLSLYPSYCY